jgi:glutathione S-transferase
MITLHDLENSRSQRVLWLLEELQLPYKVKHYKRNPQTMLAPPELKAIHPLGKSPLLTDGDKVIAESAFICEYLTQKAGKFKPQDSYWLHYAEGSLMPPLLLALIFSEVEKKAPWPVRPIAKAIAGQVRKAFIGPQTKLHLDYVEAHLAKHEWFSGNDLSSADIMMSFPLEAAQTRGGEGRPAITAWLKKIHARPAYQAAIRKEAAP